MLQGFKTYLVAFAAVAAAVLGWLQGEISLLQAIEAAGLALALGGNRAVSSAVELITKPGVVAAADPNARQWVTYIGAAVTIATAVLAFMNGQQDLTVTVTAILGALGLNFLGLGTKRAVTL